MYARPDAVSPSRAIVPGCVFCTKELHKIRYPPAPGADLLLAEELDRDVGHPQRAVQGEQRRKAVVVAHHHRVGELPAQRPDLDAIRDGLKVTHWFLLVISNRSRLHGPAVGLAAPGRAARRRVGSAGEGLGAEAAPRHEGGHGEIDQVDHARYRLATAEARDHRANK